MPSNTTHAAALAPPIPEGQPAQMMPDWLLQQQTILRTAADGDTAIRLLYADLLAERALLLSENTRLQLALQAALVPPVAPARRAQRAPLRPQILARLRAWQPQTRAELEAGLNIGALADPLREMVKAGLLTLVEGSYAIMPPERALAPAAFTMPPDPFQPQPPAARTKRGKIRAPDAA
jgi:hypothetical protein